MIIRLLVLLFLSAIVAGRARGRTHSYPHSTGYSGHGTGGGHVSHSYPQSTGFSGNNVKVQQTYHQQHNTAQYNYRTKTEVHNHYHYNPPQQIHYGSAYHPVYHGTPPVYVYEYRDSGSRFDSLLTGLALYNLGRNSRGHDYDRQREYSGHYGETCKLGISRRTGEYEETRINCNLLSSFIWEDTTPTTRNQQQITVEVTETKGTGSVNGNSSSTKVIVKSETIVDALEAKGPSIPVTPDMTCYMIRTYRDVTTMRKHVNCGLLQEYARSSLQRNSSQRLVPLMTTLFYFLIYIVIY